MHPAQAALKQVAAAIQRDPTWLNILPPNPPLSLLRRLAAHALMRPLLGDALAAE